MAARHRVTAGRHLGAGRLVRLTQDFFVYNAPCPDGSCNEGPTCECPPCEDGDFLDGTGVGGADNSRNATDVLLAGGSAAFHQTNGGVNNDNFFGLGAINRFVPSHTQVFSENRKNFNDAGVEHAPVFNISHNFAHARYRKGVKAHQPIPNVPYSVLKSVIGTTPAMSMGDSSGFINSVQVRKSSGGVDFAFDNSSEDIKEDNSPVTDPRLSSKIEDIGYDAIEKDRNFTKAREINFANTISRVYGDAYNRSGGQGDCVCPNDGGDICRFCCGGCDSEVICSGGVFCQRSECPTDPCDTEVCFDTGGGCCNNPVPNPCLNGNGGCGDKCVCEPVLDQFGCFTDEVTCDCDPPCEPCDNLCGQDEDCNCIDSKTKTCTNRDGDVCSEIEYCPGQPVPECPPLNCRGFCPGTPEKCPPNLPCGSYCDDTCEAECPDDCGCPENPGVLGVGLDENGCPKGDCLGNPCETDPDPCEDQGLCCPTEAPFDECQECDQCADERSVTIKSGEITSIKGNYVRGDIVPIAYFNHNLNGGLEFASGNQLVVGPRDTVMSCVLELTVKDVFGRLAHTAATPRVKPLKLSVYRSKVAIDTSYVSCNNRDNGQSWTSDSGRNETDRDLVATSSVTIGDEIKPLDKITFDLTEIARDAARNNNGVMNFMIEASDWFAESTGLRPGSDDVRPAMLLQFFDQGAGAHRPKVKVSVNQGLRPATQRLNPAVARRRATAGL